MLAINADGLHWALSKAFSMPIAAACIPKSFMYVLVSTTTGVAASLGSERINLSTSTPERSGIIRSSTTRSGLAERKIAIAAEPLAAVFT